MSDPTEINRKLADVQDRLIALPEDAFAQRWELRKEQDELREQAREFAYAVDEDKFDDELPAAGRYAVLVHGFETDQVSGGPGANYTLLSWSFGLFDDQGNMTANGPAFVNAGTTANVTVNWAGLLSDTIYLGGVSHKTPQGLSAITVISIGN